MQQLVKVLLMGSVMIGSLSAMEQELFDPLSESINLSQSMVVEVDDEEQFYNPEIVFYCPYCCQHMKESEEADLNFHLENTHNICSACKQKCSSPKSVRRHILKFHVTRNQIKTMG